MAKDVWLWPVVALLGPTRQRDILVFWDDAHDISRRLAGCPCSLLSSLTAQTLYSPPQSFWRITCLEFHSNVSRTVWIPEMVVGLMEEDAERSCWSKRASPAVRLGVRYEKETLSVTDTSYLEPYFRTQQSFRGCGNRYAVLK